MKNLPPLSQANFLSRNNINENVCIFQGKYALQKEYDFDVFLPSKNMNLQRGFVWDSDQKEAFIESVIIKRFIPSISAILTIDDVYEIIDGKQRLSTLISYLKDEFTYCGYLYSELPEKYRFQIERFYVTAHIIFENTRMKISDDIKIEWFRFINFSGTTQDREHMNKLSM